MESTTVQKIARVLKTLVIAMLGCNLAALFFVPGMAYAAAEMTQQLRMSLTSGLVWLLYFARAWAGAWTDPYAAMLAAFLLFSGGCTAGILWQGRRVLNAILRGRPFSLENAVSLSRAALCAFLISAAALVRVIWSCWYYGSAAPLISYNALFIPVFAMAGLLCLVMSALFRQAAELKAENDLTI